MLGLETPKSPLLKITCGKRDSCVAHVSKTLRTFFVIIEENFMFLNHWLGNVVSIAYSFYVEKNTIIPVRPIKLQYFILKIYFTNLHTVGLLYNQNITRFGKTTLM